MLVQQHPVLNLHNSHAIYSILNISSNCQKSEPFLLSVLFYQLTFPCQSCSKILHLTVMQTVNLLVFTQIFDSSDTKRSTSKTIHFLIANSRMWHDCRRLLISLLLASWSLVWILVYHSNLINHSINITHPGKLSSSRIAVEAWAGLLRPKYPSPYDHPTVVYRYCCIGPTAGRPYTGYTPMGNKTIFLVLAYPGILTTYWLAAVIFCRKSNSRFRPRQ